MKKWPLILAAGGIGFLIWYEKDRFFIDSRKLLTIDQLKAQVAQVQAQGKVTSALNSSYVHTVESDGRLQIMFTTADQENKMGLDSYKQILAKEKICQDQAVNSLINRIGWRIASVVPPNNFQWQFNTLCSSTVNAFCLPGGEVAVYTGLLPYCANEAQLAAVLSHEISHAMARHGGERMAETGILQGIETGFTKALKGLGFGSNAQNAALSAFGYASQMGLTWPFSRMQETEADDMGLNYMAAAGYDPGEAVKFWGRFSQAVASPPALFSDHPASDARMADLQSRLDKAMEYYSGSAKFGSGDSVPKAVC